MEQLGLEHARAAPSRSARRASSARRCRNPSPRGRRRTRRSSPRRPSSAGGAGRARARAGGGDRGRRGGSAPRAARRPSAVNGPSNRPPATCSTSASRSSGLNGLCRNASAPAFFASSSLEPLPERTTPGSSRVAGSAFSARQKDRPSVPGIATSRTITSGRLASIRCWASAALWASSTSMSMISKVVRSSTSRPGSSSTSRTRSGRVPGDGDLRRAAVRWPADARGLRGARSLRRGSCRPPHPWPGRARRPRGRAVPASCSTPAEWATPPERVGRLRPRRWSRAARRMRSPARTPASAAPAMTTANSSPPIRNTCSFARTARRKTRASVASTSSPAAWPPVSLTVLKPSTSSSATVTGSSPFSSSSRVELLVEGAAVGEAGERVPPRLRERERQAALLGKRRGGEVGDRGDELLVELELDARRHRDEQRAEAGPVSHQGNGQRLAAGDAEPVELGKLVGVGRRGDGLGERPEGDAGRARQPVARRRAGDPGQGEPGVGRGQVGGRAERARQLDELAREQLADPAGEGAAERVGQADERLAGALRSRARAPRAARP